jgi:hypothetical protein
MTKEDKAIVQAAEMSFDLQSLGWKAFQQLCATITSEVLGQSVEMFLPSQDAGRDGAFRGKWRRVGSEEFSGPFTIQCKFTSKHNIRLTASAIREEFEKARWLGLKGLAQSYIVMTNYGVSGPVAEEIRSMFLEIAGIKHCAVFGRDWITSKIRESARLRMLVPRVYGLGDLSQILDERAYAQAREILSVMGDDLAKFVITDAHQRSAKALIEHGFVLLLGEPASGKSTIAASLSLGALDVWQCSTLKIRNATEFKHHWNPNEPRQFFWIDDAFGPNQYLRSSVDNWNSVLVEMNAAIKKGARILFTSRDYIYKAAVQDLKATGFPLFRESQVIINVHHLTLAEKQQILYNHIKLGVQPKEFKVSLKPYLTDVASSSNFLPETARRLGDPIFTRKLKVHHEGVRKFVEEPVAFLVDVLESMDRASQAAIALLFMNGGTLKSPVILGRSELRTIRSMGAHRSDVIVALKAMNGSLVKLVQVKGEMMWIYKHPTIADAFATIIAGDSELLDIYLVGTKIDRLIEEIVCCDVELEGAQVIIPINQYQLLLGRLTGLPRHSLLTFLSSRCDKRFLTLYLEKHPQLLDDICSVDGPFVLSREIPVAAKLHEYGLFPCEYKARLLESITEAAIINPDTDFMDPKIMRGLLAQCDVDRILERIREDLIPVLDDVVREMKHNYDRSDSPDDYFSSIISTLQVIQEALNDAEVTNVISSVMNRIHSAIWDFQTEIQELSYEDPDYGHAVSSSLSEGRSIFDDVDE